MCRTSRPSRRQQPTTAAAFRLLSTRHFLQRSGKLREAADDLDRASRLNPQFIRYYAEKKEDPGTAQAYDKRGLVCLAKRDFEAGRAFSPRMGLRGSGRGTSRRGASGRTAASGRRCNCRLYARFSPRTVPGGNADHPRALRAFGFLADVLLARSVLRVTGWAFT